MQCNKCRAQLEPGKTRCRACGSWTWVSQAITPFVSLADVPDDDETARLTRNHFWAKLIGGGFVKGCVYLMAGEPGAGKSTISLQIADACAGETGLPTLYLNVEEKASRIKARSQRLGCKNFDQIILPRDPITPELEILESTGPVGLVVIDSLSALARRNHLVAVEICNRATSYAQSTETAVFIVDHVTKDEDFSGLMTLQHAVDTTMYFRADFKKKTRAIHTNKDRNGDGYVSMDVRMTANEGIVPAVNAVTGIAPPMVTPDAPVSSTHVIEEGSA